MENIWEILKIEETGDIRTIKRAYAALAKEYNPEEHPEEFLRIREAYEQALAWAGNRSSAPEPVRAERRTDRTPEETGPVGNPKEFSWNFTEENPYEKHPAFLAFRELYTGKRRRDRIAWMDYFVSDDFLEVWREEEFTSAVSALVEGQQAEYPLNKEFLTELYLAYGIRCHAQQLFLENNAAFHGIEHIMEIVQKGPFITRFKGNDSAVAAGFRDYRELLSLAAEGNWNDGNMLRLAGIIDRYILGNISDRPIKNEYQYELSQRHPKSLKLIHYFFANTPLMETAYRLLWNHLHLDTATSGKTKLFYGGLRDTVIAHVPDVLDKPRVNYRELNKKYGHYVYYTAHHKTEAWTAEREAAAKEEIDAFLSGEDVQCALMDERYVEGHVLHYWITEKAYEYFVIRLENFFMTHETAPYRDRVLDAISYVKGLKRIEREYREDETFQPAAGTIDFQKRPYVRYYLNTAFHMASGVRSSAMLDSYLQSHLPFSQKWAASLVDPDGGGFSPDRPLEIHFGENTIRIVFHLKYLEYRWNDAPVGPAFPWERLKEIQDEIVFWLLLPITAAPFSEYSAVCREVTGRLAALPLCQEDIPVIADCICGKVCRFEEDMENGLPLATLYRETEERLYGCDIYRDGSVLLYEQTPQGQNSLPNGQFHASDMGTAVSMAERLLQEMTSAYSVKACVSLMPGKLFVRNQWNQPSVLTEEQVTEEALQELLEKYFDGKLNRLELSWETRALIFLNQKGRCACLYFDSFKSCWYALVSMPEVYATVEAKDVVYVPFGLDVLPNYLVHQNLNYMKKNLNRIFSQVACALPNPEAMFWSSKVYRTETKLRYRLAERLFGGYTAEQAQNQLTDRFYIPVLPERIQYTDLEGRMTELSAARNKGAVQEALFRYMSGQLSRLILIWQLTAEMPDGGSLLRERRILLLQDQGKHQMVYMDGQEKGLEYLVANVREYLDAEGRKCRRTSFLGKTVPGYLVHEELRRIRDYLDLLIPQIQNPGPIVGQFGEFSYEEGPWKDPSELR